MASGSLKELYLDELGDLYDTETQRILTLTSLAEAAQSPELRETLLRQCVQARLRIERLDLIFTHWGAARPTRRSTAMAAIVQQADGRVHEHPTDTRDAAIVGIAYRIAHYEMAAYDSARLYARWLNRLDDVRLLEEALNEEVRGVKRLTDIAETHVASSFRPAA